MYTTCGEIKQPKLLTRKDEDKLLRLRTSRSLRGVLGQLIVTLVYIILDRLKRLHSNVMKDVTH